MSDIPGDLKFHESHEWARLEDDGKVRIGISDHAQELLGDVVFVELPEVDDHVETEDGVAVVESVKAASDIYPPIAGTVVAVNETLEDEPEQVNQDPYGNGWLFLIAPDDVNDLEQLLSPKDYEQLLEQGEDD